MLLRHQIVWIFEPVDLLDMEFFAQAFQLDRFLYVIETEQHLLRLDVLPRLDSDGRDRASSAWGYHDQGSVPQSCPQMVL